jgi:hypothetical protein
MAKARKPGFMNTAALFWRTLAKNALDDYQPELHYMRGPGPKWREKHDLAASAADSEPPILVKTMA